MRSFLMMQGVVLQIIRQWFTNNSSGFKYDPEPLTTKIEIDMSFKWTPEATQMRPGIYLKRDAYLTKGMGARAGMDDLMSYQCTGEDVYAFFPAMQLTVFTVGKYAGEVEELASELTELLMGMCPVIREELKLMKFDLEQVGGIQKTEEYKEMWVVPLTLTMTYSEQFCIKEFAPLIKSIRVDAYSEMSQVADEN